jgi:hypothetical protein
MQIKRYGAERIAQYGRSRATLYATGRHHRASIHHISPRQMPWSSIFGVKNRVVVLWKLLPEASVKKAQNGPSTQLIESTSCIKRSIATINSFTNKDSGGNKKLPPRSFSTVGIVPEIRRASTQLSPQTSSPWCSVCPPYGVDSMNHPNPTRGRPSKGVGRRLLGGVLHKSIK